MLIHFVNRFLLNFSVFCCFFIYVCIIHDTFYFVNNSNYYYFYFMYFKFSNIWLKCYEKDWFYTISENLAVHCSFSCSIIHYPIVGDEPFFIWMAEIIFGADPDPFKYFLHFFCCCRFFPFLPAEQEQFSTTAQNHLLTCFSLWITSFPCSSQWWFSF